MARLMIGAGVQPTKVWIYGNLHTPSQNNPACHVDWGWHVAPTLQVTSGKSPGMYDDNWSAVASNDPSVRDATVVYLRLERRISYCLVHDAHVAPEPCA